MAGDVFEEHPLGAALADDAGDVRPEVTGVVGPAALASRAEGLARISGEDRVEGAAKGPCIEGTQIVPDWRGCEIPSALGGDKHSSGPFLPFDKGASVIAGLGQHEAQIKASAACAEGQSVPGT
jgi:hypothetical protein